MWEIDNPDAVVNISQVGGKVWWIEPGSLVVDGDILRFRLKGIPRKVQVHKDEVASIVSEED